MPAFRLKFSSTARAATLAAAAFMVAASGAPARAQFLGDWGWQSPQPAEAVPAGLIFRRLMSRGLNILGPLRRNGGVYLADVQDRYGHRERLVIDAYSGAVLQTFAYGPPRPEAPIPEARAYAPGPVYASRYPPDSLPPGYVPPGMIPQSGLAPAPSRESKAKQHPERKLARREVAPKSKRAPTHETAPSEATREPGPPSSAAPASNPTPQKAERSSGSAEAEAVGSNAATAAPKPVAPAPKPASKPVTGPGYANGVPINPLD